LEVSGLFDAPAADRSPSERTAETVEQRLDDFAERAKEATQLAGKVRASLNVIAKNAQDGRVFAAAGQLARLSDALMGLSAAVDRLNVSERSSGLRGPQGIEAGYARELQTELLKKGIEVRRGPDPYWLAYPAWFKVERNSKGLIEVILNGDKLDSVRPAVVAGLVADAVNEKFNVKQFCELLDKVWQLLRTAGSMSSSVSLDVIYDVLALEPGRRAAGRKDFTKAAFYYSVHRLAEELDLRTDSATRFPPANRTDMMFFTKGGEARKYLVVDFKGASSL
jgi:hypothetical protein